MSYLLWTEIFRLRLIHHSLSYHTHQLLWPHPPAPPSDTPTIFDWWSNVYCINLQCSQKINWFIRHLLFSDMQLLAIPILCTCICSDVFVVALVYLISVSGSVILFLNQGELLLVHSWLSVGCHNNSLNYMCTAMNYLITLQSLAWFTYNCVLVNQKPSVHQSVDYSF